MIILTAQFLPESLAIDHIYECHLRSGELLSPKRRSYQTVCLGGNTSIMIVESSGSARWWKDISSVSAVLNFTGKNSFYCKIH